MRRNKFFTLLTFVALLLGTCTASAQFVDKHKSEELKIGVAGFSFRSFDIDQTLKMMNQIGVKYMSVKDFHLPLSSTQEQIDAFKAKLAAAGVEGYILGPIYMNSKADVDRTFEYVKRYGTGIFIGVPTYELLPYIDQKVKEYDIKMAIHTHGPDISYFPLSLIHI